MAMKCERVHPLRHTVQQQALSFAFICCPSLICKTLAEDLMQNRGARYELRFGGRVMLKGFFQPKGCEMNGNQSQGMALQ